jgi:hypothetical protein
LLAPLALDGTSAGGFLRVIRANALEHAGLTFLALVGPLLCCVPGVTRRPYCLTPLMTWTLRTDVPAMTFARRVGSKATISQIGEIRPANDWSVLTVAIS